VNAANPLKDKVDFTIWTADNSYIITRIKEVADGFNTQIYPNPTTGKVNISLNWKDTREVVVRVFSLTGNEVFRRSYTSGEKIEFNLSQHAAGAYMIRLESGDYSEISKIILDKR